MFLVFAIRLIQFCFLLNSLDNQAVYEGEKLTTKTSVTANFLKPKFRDFCLNTLEVDEFTRDTFVNGYSLGS